LWENEDPALITALLHLLQTDETPVVRAAAATALGRFIYLSEVEEIDPHYTAPATKALRETIHQPAEDTEVRRRAVESIAFWGEPEVNRIIENAYYDEDEKMQISAIFAMGRSADNRWGSYLLPELNNPNPAIRYEAARACGELEIGQALEKLIELIEYDPDVEVQESAIWALGRLGGNIAQGALEACLESDNENLALAAKEALDELLLFSGSFDLFDFTGDDDLEAFLDMNHSDELM
jgi:HEAT repeat protein